MFQCKLETGSDTGDTFHKYSIKMNNSTFERLRLILGTQDNKSYILLMVIKILVGHQKFLFQHPRIYWNLYFDILDIPLSLFES